MKILGIDHCSVVTDDVPATVDFYERVLGFTNGSRPEFEAEGAWLYQNGNPLVHVIRGEPGIGCAALEHVAFAAAGLAEFVDRLRSLGVNFLLKRQPPPAHTWQVFVRDPNDVRVEINFDPAEREI